MKRSLFVLLCCLLASVSAWAKVVSESQARMVAQSFRQTGARSVAVPTLVYTGMASHSGARVAEAPTFYVYNYGADQGFVIVAGDDCVPSILAYADKGRFSAGDAMPSQVAWWLDTYSAYIDGARSGTRALVQAPDLGDFEVAVQPLVKTLWDQAEPYNGLCPMLSADERCATGCAATAIAQVMNYHQWPESGEGSVTHGGLVMDFSQSVYDWDNMLDTYTPGAYSETEGRAVAKLMLDVGMSVKMAYGYESGAQNVHIYRSLYTYFKYSKKAQFVSLNSMTGTEWTSLIRAELEAGRPVYYSGVSEDQTMGHAFLCDGISEDNLFFHFNWGWSGNCNGFYSVFVLNPPIPGIGGGQGNFNLDHWAIVGIEPAKDEDEESGIKKMPVLVMTDNFRTSTTQTSLGRSFPVDVNGIANYGPDDATFQLAIGLFKNGEFRQTVSGVQNLSMSEFRGSRITNYAVTLPHTTATGDYELRVVIGADGEWSEPVYERGVYLRSIHLTVKEGKVTVHPAKTEGLELMCVVNGQIPADMPSTLLPGKLYPMRARIINQGVLHFSGVVGYRLLKCPEEASGPSAGVTQDTVTVSEGTTQMFLYSGNGAKDYNFDIRLNESGKYLLNCYYIDPVSKNEVPVFSSNPISVEEPAVKYPRRVVVEQLGAGGDPGAMQQLAVDYPDNFIGITVYEGESAAFPQSAYIDSLNVPAGKSVLMNRVRSSSLKSVANAEAYLQDWLKVPAIASVEAKARYSTWTNDSVELELTTRFAYTAEDIDMRLAVVALNRTPINGSGDGWTYTDEATGFHPADAWGGVRGAIPSSVKAGEDYVYTMKLKPQYDEELILVGLLVDGETGKICNAVSVRQSEIAPMDGEAQPVSVNLERTSATMNTGLSVQLTASVSPAIASQELVWTSSNPEVATVSNDGRINSLSAGTAIIRATSSVNLEVYAEMTLTVNQADYTQVQLVEAGCLHYLVDFETCPQELILGGELNGTDIALIRSMAGAHDMAGGDAVLPLACPLSVLDISQCRIVAGGTPYYKEYVTQNDVIGAEMFGACISLEKVLLPQGVVAIGDNAFVGSSLIKSLEIPSAVAAIGYAPFHGCQGLETFTVNEKNTAFKSVDGVLYNAAGTELVAYPAAKQDTVYEAIETLTRILPYAFNEARYLKRFLTNMRLSAIGYGAFYNACSLEVITFCSRLKSVEEYAFAGCVALDKIFCAGIIPAECADNAFEGVSQQCVLYVPNEDVCAEYAISPGWKHFTTIVNGAYSVPDIVVGTPVTISSLDSGFELFGVPLGETVSVYNASGMLVYRAKALEEKMQIPLSTSGLYIVRMEGFAGKVIVR